MISDRIDENGNPVLFCKHASESAYGLVCAKGLEPYFLASGVKPFRSIHVPCHSNSIAFCRSREIEGAGHG